MLPGNLRSVFVYSSAPGSEASPPLGAGCVVASLMKTGLAAKEDILLLDAGTCPTDAALIEAVAAFSPDFVGFSLYLWNSRRFVGLASRLRESNPGLLIVAGGPDAEAQARAAPLPSFFDAIFLGEAERSLSDWLASLSPGFRAGASGSVGPQGSAVLPRPAVLRGPVPEAAELPSPWTSGLLRPESGGSAAWELVRGCPYRCAYCYEGRGVAGMRYLPRERIEAELEILRSSGVSEVFVLDPTFNARSAEALSLLALLAERGGEIRWNFEIRAELVDRAQARAFSRLPCSLQIGLQSADPEVLSTIGRSLDRKQFASKVRLLDEAGLVYGFDLIYGLPGDDLSGFRHSIDFALSLAPNHLDIFPLSVLPGTILFDRREELALDCSAEPPYLLKRNPSFSEADMAAAEKLAASTRLFYSMGRAVPWFKAVLKPLRMSPSAFLGGLDVGEAGSDPGHRRIEVLQCAYVERMYKDRHLEKLLPAALDLVHYYGAWSRAFAEGERSSFELNYPLKLVESPAMLDIERTAASRRPKPKKVEVWPGRGGPRAVER